MSIILIKTHTMLADLFYTAQHPTQQQHTHPHTPNRSINKSFRIDHHHRHISPRWSSSHSITTRIYLAPTAHLSCDADTTATTTAYGPSHSHPYCCPAQPAMPHIPHR